ncbi:translocase [Agrobacterium sp. TS43]|uniref:Sec-independent protein translocase protein TatB n=1 Tax=Agrobacterium TaxID=357 RepID=UPI0003815DC6|nr:MULTISPECIES: Sec-independent protein translocase protein TatB [Agrobacterium]EPR19314.1 translocase [Agrobacterium radiobacter DSM 30147]KDR90752.1 preprotein translocase [Agrobacterium tumefaciens GW4]KVK40294.1 translocase [Agrobacterium sp. JL28]KVK40844.1 translocase [Agrobacterium sp. LY4]KVK54772.1 translocase [Agrobacterium sp. TS45]
MLDIGWSELLVIAVVLIVVVGPKDLPPMIRAFGKTMAGLRKMAGDFRTQFDEALKEADMDDVRQTISDVRNLNPTNSLRDAMNPLRQLGNEIKSDLQKATTPPDGLSSTPAPVTSEPVAPLVSVPEPEMKLPDAPPAVAAPVAAVVAAEEKPKRARAKSIATVEAEAVAAKPKRAARSKAAAATPETASATKTAAKTSEPTVSKPAVSNPTVKAVAKKAAVRKSAADKAVVAETKPAKTAKTKAAKPKKDEA